MLALLPSSFILNHDALLIKALIYMLCMGGMLMLVLFAAPELYAVIMLSTASAIFGWALVVMMGVFLGWILTRFVLGASKPEVFMAASRPVETDLPTPGRSTVHIASRLDPSSTTLDTNLVKEPALPPVENKQAQEEKKELEIRPSPITELKAEGQLKFDVFASRICVFRSFPNHLLLLPDPDSFFSFQNSNRLTLIVMNLNGGSDKMIITSWPGRLVGLKESQQGLEVYAVATPGRQVQEEKAENNHQVKIQQENSEESKLLNKIAQRYYLLTDSEQQLASEKNPAMVELTRCATFVRG